MVDGIITKGIITTKKDKHNGIDIASPFKSKINATQKGIIILSDKLPHLGNTIIIAHPNNYYSLFMSIYYLLLIYIKLYNLVGKWYKLYFSCNE